MKPEEITQILQNQKFIREHLKEDPATLMLKFGRDSRLEINQIAARQKIRKKTPSWYGNFQLVFPPSLSIEQASSEATAQLKSELIKGRHLLDITGGLGVDISFLAPNFTKATYVERDAALCTIAKHNFNLLNQNIEVLNSNGIEILKRSEADVIYADPHRRDNTGKKIFRLRDTEPNLLPVLPYLINNQRTTIIKTSPLLDIHQGISELEYVKEIWVISVKNECKEVLFILHQSAQNSSQNIEVKTFNINGSEHEEFAFKWNNRLSSHPEQTDPLLYLYEPNASILKAQAQDLVAIQMHLLKLHPNSHLFTSNELISSFPGKVFKVEGLYKPYDKALKNNRFNVISRNFPDKAHIIEKKLRLKPSETDYLIATTGPAKQKYFIRCGLLAL